jgi:hypothetical protein
MDDPGLMCRAKRFEDLPGDFEMSFDRERPLEPFPQRLAVH